MGFWGGRGFESHPIYIHNVKLLRLSTQMSNLKNTLSTRYTQWNETACGYWYARATCIYTADQLSHRVSGGGRECSKQA